MPIRPQFRLCWLAAPALLAGTSALPAKAAQTVQLLATRYTLLADGKQQTTLTVNVQGTGLISNPEVIFNTTKGTLSAKSVRVLGGIAQTTLTSAPVAGIAEVTAFVTGGVVSNPIQIEFTDDPEATFEGNNYMLVTGKGYLAYSATDKIIEAQGKEGGAHLSFRNYDLTADRIRIECNDHANVRATGHVVLKRGKDVLKGFKLNFSLASNEGQAVAEVNDHLEPVKVEGQHLRTTHDDVPAPASRYAFPELQVKLIISATSITYFPGSRLQFKSAHFYQDQAQILALPYYELALNSEELFSDHFISVGTRGLGLDLPFYYNLTPRNSGIIDIHHGQQLGRSFFSVNQGFGVDVLQGYSSGGDSRYEGAYGFTNLLSNSWDFRWQHSAQLNPTTQASTFLNFPNHDSVLATTSLTQSTRTLRYGLNVSEGQTFTSDQSNSFHNDVYVETQPHRLFDSKVLNYVMTTNFSTTRLTSHDSAVTPFNDTSEQVALRAFTRPIKLDSRTSFTNSFSAGQLWDGPTNTGILGLATMSLDRTLSGGGVVNLTYDFATRPLHTIDPGGHHRVSLNYSIANNKHVQLTLFGSTFLDANNTSLLADAAYRINKDWRLLTVATVQQYNSTRYTDLEFSIGRRIGAREFQLTYSTYNRRFSFDLTATRF